MILFHVTCEINSYHFKLSFVAFIEQLNVQEMLIFWKDIIRRLAWDIRWNI